MVSEVDLGKHSVFNHAGLLFRAPIEVVAQQTDGYDAACEPGSIFEPPPTVFDILEIDSADHGSQSQCSTSATSNEKYRTGSGKVSGRCQQTNLSGREDRKSCFCIVLMGLRYRLDPCLGVIFDVHVCIYHVIHQSPRYTAGVECRSSCNGGGIRHQIGAQGGKAHDGTPGECQAEDELRVMSDSLG